MSLCFHLILNFSKINFCVLLALFHVLENPVDIYLHVVSVSYLVL